MYTLYHTAYPPHILVIAISIYMFYIVQHNTLFMLLLKNVYIRFVSYAPLLPY